MKVAPTDPVEVRALYDAWADRYEEEVDAWDCDSVHVSAPRPYLPKSDEMADVGVILGVLRNR